MSTTTVRTRDFSLIAAATFVVVVALAGYRSIGMPLGRAPTSRPP